MRKYINVRNEEESESEDLNVTVLDENFFDITKEYLPLAEDYIMGSDH